MTRSLLSLFAFLLLAPPGSADETVPSLKDKNRILFLGDSITHAGHYIVLLDAALQGTATTAEFINLGLPSEGCTGLSEPAHPFPRPNVHDRLDRALEKSNPDLVFACYGMNDGIYYPFSEERFAKYQAGINLLIEKVAKHGAPLILLTPPPFDPLPLKKRNKLLPATAEKFSWMRIYEHYDRDVIKRYGAWLKTRKEQVTMVIDLHEPITKYVTAKRKDNPGFALSGDGVHINHEGDRIIADTIHRSLYRKALPEIPAERVKLFSQRHKILHASWLSHVGHKRPGMKAGLPLAQAHKKAGALKP